MCHCCASAVLVMLCSARDFNDLYRLLLERLTDYFTKQSRLL